MAFLEKPVVLHRHDVVIRSAVADDAEALVDYFLAVTAQSDNLTFEPDETAMFADEAMFLENLETSPNALALVAEHDGAIVGSLTFIGGTRPKVKRIGGFGITVECTWWDKGIGSALVQALVTWAEKARIGKIHLQVRTDNPRAIALYRKFGFVDEAVLRHVLCIRGDYVDLLWMGLALGDASSDESDVSYANAAVSENAPQRVALQGPIAIRELQPGDAQAILDYFDQIVTETDYLQLGPEGLQLSRTEEQAILSQYQQDKRKLYIGAFTGEGNLVGTLSFAAGNRRRTCHAGEFSLTVLQSFQGHGIGTALLQRLVNWAPRVGIHRIGLEVRAENTRAIALYERCGFVTEGRISRTMYSNGSFHDSIVMAMLI
ncbi:MAG: GNAT family N-acetyltransferase [Sphaerochaetaceae bacterium]